MYNSTDPRREQEVYGELHLSEEESEWVRHYLHVADHVLFGRRMTPRVVVVEEEWRVPSRQPSIVPRHRTA